VGVISIMLLATILNGSAAVSSGKDPIDTIVPAGVFTLVLEFLYDEVNPKVATALTLSATLRHLRTPRMIDKAFTFLATVMAVTAVGIALRPNAPTAAVTASFFKGVSSLETAAYGPTG
jgi:hypothetical protein